MTLIRLSYWFFIIIIIIQGNQFIATVVFTSQNTPQKLLSEIIP